MLSLADAAPGRAGAGGRRIADAAVPAAQVRWRYRVILNALAVAVPAESVGRLEQVDGVAAVHRSSVYRPQLDRSPAAIGAPALWGPGLATAGQGMKIAIIDDGIDHRHPSSTRRATRCRLVSEGPGRLTTAR